MAGFGMVPGMAGILVTCNRGKEAVCVREMYEMLSDYFDSDETASFTLKGDIEDALVAEVNELGNTKKKQYLSVGMGRDLECLVFIRLRDSDPVETAKKILASGHNRVLRATHRLIPLQGTCYTNVADFSKMARNILKEHLFGRYDSGSCTFAVIVESRKSDSLDKRVVIELLGEMAGAAGYKVNLKKPQIVIMIQILKNICGMSVIDAYYERNKMNIQAS